MFKIKKILKVRGKEKMKRFLVVMAIVLGAFSPAFAFETGNDPGPSAFGWLFGEVVRWAKAALTVFGDYKPPTILAQNFNLPPDGYPWEVDKKIPIGSLVTVKAVVDIGKWEKCPDHKLRFDMADPKGQGWIPLKAVESSYGEAVINTTGLPPGMRAIRIHYNGGDDVEDNTAYMMMNLQSVEDICFWYKIKLPDNQQSSLIVPGIEVAPVKSLPIYVGTVQFILVSPVQEQRQISLTSNGVPVGSPLPVSTNGSVCFFNVPSGAIDFTIIDPTSKYSTMGWSLTNESVRKGVVLPAGKKIQFILQGKKI